MVIIRDDNRIARFKQRSRQVSLIGIVMLVGGFILVFLEIPNLLFYQTMALLGGWVLSQIGMYLAHRYARTPRPDEVLDDALKPIARNGRLYHYVLPVPHVLLTRAGPIVFNLKFQTGRISVDNDKWSQKGIGTRRFFGQEGLGNPTKETESMIRGLAGFISKQVPEIEEVPIGAMIVFTTKNIESLELNGSTIPAMHASKLKGYLRQKGMGEPLPEEEYEALRQAFDRAAGDLVDTDGDDKD
jgi:hypothetical protein